MLCTKYNIIINAFHSKYVFREEQGFISKYQYTETLTNKRCIWFQVRFSGYLGGYFETHRGEIVRCPVYSNPVLNQYDAL